MGTAVRSKLEDRVIKAAEVALADRNFVTAIDVLIGAGWLTTPQVDRWRQGRVDYLERLVRANLSKISTAMAAFRQWAQKEGLNPSETAYLSQARDHHPLRFSKSGDARIEAAYRTHWVSPKLSEAKKERLAGAHNRAPDLVVISPLKEWNCEECGSTGDFLFMEGTDRCASSALISTNWSSWLPATLHSPGERRRRADLLQSWCDSAARGAATSAKGFSSKKRHSPKRKRPA
jgi:hypothetical protein